MSERTSNDSHQTVDEERTKGIQLHFKPLQNPSTFIHTRRDM